MGIDRKVEKTKVITEYGALVCNYAQKPGTRRQDWPKLYIHFNHTHGVMNGEYGLAHDDDCKPDNIGRFRFCYSPCYEMAAKAIRVGTPEELEENRAAAEARGDKICLGRYVNQWFDADEKQMIERYTKQCQEIPDGLDVVYDNYYTFKRKVHDITGENPYNTNQLAAGYDKELNQSIEEDLELIESYISAVQTISGSIMIISEDFVQPKNVLAAINDNLDKMIDLMNGLKDKLKGFDYYEGINKPLSTAKSSIRDVQEKIKAAPAELEEWKDSPYHLITMDSYLVCRCGGMLSFHNDGQTYHEVLDRITKATEDLIGFMEQECTTWYNGYLEWEIDSSSSPELKTEREQELRDSEQALQKVKELKDAMNINPNTETMDDIYDGIHMEFWSHAYYEELESIGMGILGLLSIYFKQGHFLSMGLSFYQWCKEGVVDRPVTGADLSGASSFYVPFITNSVIIQGLNIFSLITTIPSFFYSSNATWIEEVRITFFTNTYAVIARQKLSEYGTKSGNPNLKKMYRHEYMDSHESNGLKWKLEKREVIEYEAYVSHDEWKK